MVHYPDPMPKFLEDLFRYLSIPALVYPLIRVAFILMFGVVVLKLIDSALNRPRKFVVHGAGVRTTRLDQRAETLSHIARGVSRTLLGVVLLLWITSELGFNIGPLLTTAGITGLAIGFGAQSLIKDIISGFFILLED